MFLLPGRCWVDQVTIKVGNFCSPQLLIALPVLLCRRHDCPAIPIRALCATMTRDHRYIVLIKVDSFGGRLEY